MKHKTTWVMSYKYIHLYAVCVLKCVILLRIVYFYVAVDPYLTVLNTEIYEYTIRVNSVCISLFPGFYKKKRVYVPTYKMHTIDTLNNYISRILYIK
jgi:hypothetical protein